MGRNLSAKVLDTNKRLLIVYESEMDIREICI